jgi:hypothetical protein
MSSSASARACVKAMIRESLISQARAHHRLAALEGAGGDGAAEGLSDCARSAANTPTQGRVTMYTGAGVSTTLGNTFRPEDRSA